jgi:hypothetical protein
VADRCGLYWLENLGPTTEKTTGDPAAVPTYTDHSNLLVVKDADGKERPVKTPFDWGQRRAHILASLEKTIALVPDSSNRVPLDVKFGDMPTAENHTLKSVTYSTAVGERTTAYLHLPKGRSGKRPAVIYPIDPSAGTPPPIGKELTPRGYVVFVVKRATTDSAAAFGRKIVRGIDLLDAMPEVDVNRIGIIGHGPGGTLGLLVAAVDQRIAATVTNGGLAPPPDAKSPGDMAEVVAALAPRPTYLIAPTKDTFDVEKANAAIASARSVFAFKQAERSLVAVYPDVGREFPEGERTKAYEWLDKILKP